MSKEEIEELTGFKMPYKQCTWLDTHAYPYDKTASGKPKVLKSYLEHRLGHQSNNVHAQQPNFDALG